MLLFININDCVVKKTSNKSKGCNYFFFLNFIVTPRNTGLLCSSNANGLAFST